MERRLPHGIKKASLWIVLGCTLLCAACAGQGGDERQAALAALRSVLHGEGAFVQAENGEQVTLDTACFQQGDEPAARASTERFAVVDMDGDGIMEAVLELAVYGGGMMVLHHHDGQVFGYSYGARALNSLKADGTYSYSNGAADGGYCRLSFDDPRVTEEELGYSRSISLDPEEIETVIAGKVVEEEAFYQFCQEQNEKEDAIWHEYTKENVDSILSSLR